MRFLRFENEQEAREAFAEYLQEGYWPAYIGNAAIDVVGIIQRPTGEFEWIEDQDVSVLAPVPGWYINLSERVPELQQYEIEVPATPDRVFAGSDMPRPQMFPAFVGNAKLDLFTRDEQLAVVEATMSDPLIKLMYDRLLGAAFLTYADPETEMGLSLLQSRGLITAVRKAEIVAAMQPA